MSVTDLTTGSIRGHIRRITIPASVGLVFNTLFNVVDTIYAGRLSTEALAGMSLSFPVFFIMLAVASGLGSGSTALKSNALGEKDHKKFHDYLFNATVVGILLSVILMILGNIISRSLLGLMGAEGEALEQAARYLVVIFYGTIFFVLNMIFNAALNAQGDTKSYRNVLIVSFGLNLILDPLFILGWFGLPKLGTAGVALATVIVQGVGTVYLFVKVLKSEKYQRALIKQCHLKISVWLELARQSIPAGLNMMTIALGVFVINYFVVRFAGDEGIAAYGVGIRIEQLALLPALGLNTAALTITGQNYGAGNYDRIKRTYKKCLLYGILIMIVGTVLIYVFAPQLMKVFNQDPAVIDIGVKYLRIEFVCFVTYVIMFISIAVLQGLKRPAIAIYVGLYRQLIMPLILFYLLGETFGLGILGVWFGIVIINWSATVFTLLYTFKKLHDVHLELEQS